MSDSGHSADPIEAIQAQLVAARRTQILDAATRVFASKGFNRSTIRDVAQDAGVADGTIYNYFANKTDLLFGLLDRLNDTERRPASLALAAEASFADYFRAYVRERFSRSDLDTSERVTALRAWDGLRGRLLRALPLRQLRWMRPRRRR